MEEVKGHPPEGEWRLGCEASQVCALELFILVRSVAFLSFFPLSPLPFLCSKERPLILVPQSTGETNQGQEGQMGLLAKMLLV